MNQMAASFRPTMTKIVVMVVVAVMAVAWWISTRSGDEFRLIDVYIDDVKITAGFSDGGHVWVPLRVMGAAMASVVTWSHDGTITVDDRSVLEFELRENITYVRAGLISEIFNLPMISDNPKRRISYFLHQDVGTSEIEILDHAPARVLVDGAVLTQSAVTVNNRIYAPATLIALALVGDFRWNARDRIANFAGTSVPFLVRGGEVWVDVASAADIRSLDHHAIADGINVVSGAPKTEVLDTVVIVEKIPTTQLIAVLTFDDGLKPATYEILEILETMSVSATFFTTGESVVAHPEIARHVAAHGHEILNHTFTHRRLDTLTDDQIAAEVIGTRLAIFQAVGCVSNVPRVRPPGGRLNPRVEEVIRRAGYHIVTWSINSHDWDQAQTAADIHRVILDEIHPGAIVLLHNAPINTVRALPSVIEDLKNLGYEFATLGSVLDESPQGSTGVITCPTVVG